MHKINWIIATAAVAVLTMSGCASTSGKPQGNSMESASKQFKEGSALVEAGEQTKQKGAEKVAEGKRQIDEASIMIERGKSMMADSEQQFREHSRSTAAK